jgi:hypothetical protein
LFLKTALPQVVQGGENQAVLLPACDGFEAGAQAVV